jgi:uncharacterized protein (UPF0335 family)
MDNHATDKLHSAIERIERLEEQRKEIGKDITEILDVCKASGLSVTAIKEVLKLRKKARDERIEDETMRETYCHAMGVELSA